MALPVLVRGVVTAPSGWKTSFFFQDSTAGISVDREDNGPPMRSGQLVEINGVTGPGLFAPIIIARKVRVLGTATLPAARRLVPGDLASGSQDSQWVELHGVVQSALVQESWGRRVLFLRVALSGNDIEVRVADFSESNISSLIDAAVRIQGVYATNFNRKRQFVGALLFVPALDNVRIEEPAPSDPFAVSLRSINSVLEFKPGETIRHRIRIQGVVTYQKPGSRLCLQDGDQGILVRSKQSGLVYPGTRVEAVGFASLGEYSPQLDNAVFRVVGRGSAPEPVKLHASEVIKVSDGLVVAPVDTLLVQLRARVSDYSWNNGRHVILLQDGGLPFEAHLETPPGVAQIFDLKSGAIITVTGVCSVHVDENREPRGFSILLRSPNDVTIVQRPSWWTPSHALAALGATCLGSLAAFAWVTLLQRRVRQKTAALNQANVELQGQIAERRLLESQLLQAQKLESIGQLAAGIAHEVNTPIQYIGDNCLFLRTSFGQMNDVMNQYIQLLDFVKTAQLMPDLVARLESNLIELDAEFLVEEIPRAIDQSVQGTERVAQIVRAMKEFSHPGSGQKAPIDLNHAIQNTLIVCRNEYKYVADLSTDLDPSLPQVRCLGGEINQVILNLVVNAAHAIGGSKAEGDRGVIKVSTRADGAVAEIRVQDNGTGIPAAIQNRIFDPFFTTKEVGKGTGQGLAMAMNTIVKKHQGTLTFETQENVGTTFIARIPIDAPSAEKQQNSNEEFECTRP
jgi:signal transduction histidine kinase